MCIRDRSFLFKQNTIDRGGNQKGGGLSFTRSFKGRTRADDSARTPTGHGAEIDIEWKKDTGETRGKSKRKVLQKITIKDDSSDDDDNAETEHDQFALTPSGKSDRLTIVEPNKRRQYPS
eukprot:TRINITY_DN13940_c0_g1_i1.p1 TRINITY_DN13940_c0_g1~~TRINITY_DN13940_c0_g1_i1.p1  ORF type:complete len:139 (+),score=43.30 TRINITY_DN13940_c0_g1_i1:60-419(+)